MMKPIAIVFLSLALALPASSAAAQQRYQQWGNPDQGAAAQSAQSGRLQEFTDRLNKLVDEAEKSRAADPRFLRDLRDLARGFDRPWRRQILSDDFLDGDYTANPGWSVTAGRYWVEKGWGLRTAIEPGQAVAPPGDKSGDRRSQRKDAAIALLGAVLNQATGNKRGGGSAPAAAQAVAAIQVPATITNAFAIEMELSSWKPQGRFEIGPYQGTAADNGYRLAYRPGGGFVLSRVSARGASIIDSTTATPLEDKKPHRVEWTRAASGVMTVTLDGKKILEATDRGIGQPFAGVTMVNRGGDYIVKRITVSGT